MTWKGIRVGLVKYVLKQNKYRLFSREVPTKQSRITHFQEEK